MISIKLLLFSLLLSLDISYRLLLTIISRFLHLFTQENKKVHIDWSWGHRIHIGKNVLYGFFYLNKIEKEILFTIRFYIEFSYADW